MKYAIVLSAIPAIASVSAWGLPNDPATGLGCRGPCNDRLNFDGKNEWVWVDCENCNRIQDNGMAGEKYDASMDGTLENCFVNNDGQLENHLFGGWRDSCEDLAVNDDGILRARCKNKKGDLVETSVDLTKSKFRSQEFDLSCI